MVITISAPLVALFTTILGGLVVSMIVGAYHYALTLVKLKVTDKKLSDVLSEVNMLHQNYKKEIADIKTHYSDTLERSIDRVIDKYEKKMDGFLEHNRPLLGYGKVVRYGDPVSFGDPL